MDSGQTNIRNVLATCLSLLSLATSSARAADDPGEQRFLRRYLCPIGQTLNTILDRPWKSKDEQNRFLILFPSGRTSAYAQCAFFDGGVSVHCEVASPFYAAKGYPVPQARLAALAHLGYDTDGSKSNYTREFKLDGEKSPRLAEFMLRSLYESFLDDPRTILKFYAPLAKSPPPGDACAPTS